MKLTKEQKQEVESQTRKRYPGKEIYFAMNKSGNMIRVTDFENGQKIHGFTALNPSDIDNLENAFRRIDDKLEEQRVLGL